jgi:hypothetical protein
MAIGGQSDIADHGYRTEVRSVRHYIGYRNKLLSHIRYPTTVRNLCSVVVSHLILARKVKCSKPVGKNMKYKFSLVICDCFINFRYWNIQY